MNETRRARAAAIALVLVALAFFSGGPARSAFNSAVMRLFPGRATLQVAPGNVRVASGSALVINARLVSGEASSAQVEMGDGARWRTVDMTTAPDGRFRLRLDSVTTPAKYRVLAGGLTSPTYAIEIVLPPRVARIDLDYAYPPESRIRPWTEEGTGDIYGPPGTEVRVRVRTDRPAVTGELALAHGETFPLTLENANELTVMLRIEGDNSYRVALAGPDGLTSFDEASHVIRVLGRHK